MSGNVGTSHQVVFKKHIMQSFPKLYKLQCKNKRGALIDIRNL